MANPAGESSGEVLRLDFDRQLMVQFHGSVVTSDTGLLAYRELDDALGLTTMAGEMLADARTGRNWRHALVGLPNSCGMIPRCAGSSATRRLRVARPCRQPSDKQGRTARFPRVSHGAHGCAQ
jgi:hypothetical protein